MENRQVVTPGNRNEMKCASATNVVVVVVLVNKILFLVNWLTFLELLSCCSRLC